jgi:hypothetical protein
MFCDKGLFSGRSFFAKIFGFCVLTFFLSSPLFSQDFSANMKNFSFNWQTPSKGTFKCDMEGTGIAGSATSSSGKFDSTVNPDGSVQIICNGNATGSDGSRFTTSGSLLMTPDRRLASTFLQVIYRPPGGGKPRYARKSVATGSAPGMRFEGTTLIIEGTF